MESLVCLSAATALAEFSILLGNVHLPWKGCREGTNLFSDCEILLSPEGGCSNDEEIFPGVEVWL